MSGPRTVVYAGPTISADAVHAVLPEAEVLPPLARGDLLGFQWNRGDTAVIIDGYFRERRSVGYKEILWLLSEGVRVLGGASMGALRAAELSPFGMHGVGVVYRMYATGEIDGDDEVGVLHGPAAMGYPPRTVALVNLRYGCREGIASNLISEAAGQRIVAAAKALPFTHRSWQEIESGVTAEDLPFLETLRDRISSGEWDLKRLDASAALQAAGEVDTTAPEPRLAESTALTGISHNWLLSRRSAREYAPDRWMSDLDVLDAARLFDDEYPRLHADALAGLLDDFAGSAGVSVQAYARAKLGVDGQPPLPARLASWLTSTELAESTPEQRLRLVMTRVWPIWQSMDWRPAVLAVLQKSDRWPEWSALVADADEAAEQDRYRLVVPPPAICGQLFLRHWRLPGTSAEVAMSSRGFAGVDDLGRAARRFFAFDLRRSRRPAKAVAGTGEAVTGA
jgi:hypothetical protein